MSAWAGENPAVELPPRHQIIDLHTLTPRQRRVAEFIGKLIGIGAVYVVAGAIWTARGIAWAIRRVRR